MGNPAILFVAELSLHFHYICVTFACDSAWLKNELPVLISLGSYTALADISGFDRQKSNACSTDMVLQWHGHHGFSNHEQLDCLLNSLCMLTTTKHQSFALQSTNEGSFPSLRATKAESVSMSLCYNQQNHCVMQELISHKYQPYNVKPSAYPMNCTTNTAKQSDQLCICGCWMRMMSC